MNDSGRQYGLVTIATLAGAALCCVPLQHYMPLSRYQHYSIALYVMAAGLLLQAVVSWRHIGLWGRCAMLSASLFVGSCAWFFYSNPWLGNLELATDDQLLGRQHFIVVLAALLAPVTFFWIKFGLQKQQALKPDEQPAKERLLP